MKRTIPLIILCLFMLISCATVKINDPPSSEKIKSSDEPTSSDALPVGNDPTIAQFRTLGKESGKRSTETITDLNLVLSWNYSYNEKHGDILHIYIDLYHTDYVPKTTATAEICGAVLKFTIPAYQKSKDLEKISIYEKTISLPENECYSFDYKIDWDVDAKYQGVEFKTLTVSGSIKINDDLYNIPKSEKLDFEPVIQLPELPNGCEITSLTAVLNYLGYDADKLKMSDDYLEKGDYEKVSPYEKNIGDPRTDDDSFGCYAPVIAKTANRYLEDQKSDKTAIDISKSTVNELLCEVANGHPVIVWATIDFEEPFFFYVWKIDGEPIYWKHPLHCMVLCGYDLEKHTVTVSDSLSGNYDVDLDLFESRYESLWAQAVVIK